MVAKRVYAILAFFLGGVVLIAQPGPYNVYPIKEGLSKGLIKDISLDTIGFVWIATDEGVIKYNGRDAVFYKDAIKGGFAKALCRRHNGSLVVLHDFGLTAINSQSDTTSFIPLHINEQMDSTSGLFYPKTIYEDTQKRLWIGENQAIVRYENGKWERYALPVNPDQGLLFRSFSFSEDQNGILWVASYSGRIFQYNEKSNIFEELGGLESLKVSGINTILCQPNGKFLLGTQNGLYEFGTNPDGHIVDPTAIAGPSQVSSCVLGENGAIYLGTWDGELYHGWARVDREFRRMESIDFLDVVGLTLDAQNGIWIASSEDIGLLSPISFQTVDLELPTTSSNNQDAAIIESLIQTPSGSILISSNRRVIEIDDQQHVKFQFLDALPESSIPTYVQEIDGYWWIGCLAGEVYKLDLATKQLHAIKEIPVSSSSILHIFKDLRGDVWISGNQQLGLIRFTANGQMFNYKDGGLDKVRKIFELNNQMLFAVGAGQNEYLHIFKRLSGQFENISSKLPFTVSPNFLVEDILASNDHKLLLGTTDGLLEIDLNISNSQGPEVSRLALDKVPINEPIKAMALSEEGRLWLSTTSGLIAKDGEYTLMYDKSGGLPSNNMVSRGLCFDDTGKLWLGTAKGVVHFQPFGADLQQTAQPIFTEIKSNSVKKLLQIIQGGVFPHHTNLEINFLALAYPADKITYQYRLRDRDTSWSMGTKQTQVVLSNLNTGHHQFEVRAQKQGGQRWSEPAKLSFTTIAPWYRRWWGLLILSLSFLGVLFLVTQWYNRNLKLQNERLEQVISERTEKINQQKNKIIEQTNRMLEQKEAFRILKERQLQQQINHKNKQLTTHMLHIIQKNEALKELRLQLTKGLRKANPDMQSHFKAYLSLIDFSFRKDHEWENFKLIFEEVHVNFFERILKKHPTITSQDLRHCALIKLNLSIQETATILGISPESVKTSRFRLRNKMSFDSQAQLVDYLIGV